MPPDYDLCCARCGRLRESLWYAVLIQILGPDMNAPSTEVAGLTWWDQRPMVLEHHVALFPAICARPIPEIASKSVGHKLLAEVVGLSIL